jgi:hypothetical protein
MVEAPLPSVEDGDTVLCSSNIYSVMAPRPLVKLAVLHRRIDDSGDESISAPNAPPSPCVITCCPSLYHFRAALSFVSPTIFLFHPPHLSQASTSTLVSFALAL